MSTTQSTRRALIVNDTGGRSASGVVRALQYKPLFETNKKWQAEYTSRHSETLANLLWPRTRRAIAPRVMLHFVRPALVAYESYWVRRREEYIVRRAAECDIVSIIKLREAILYRRLCQLSRPRVVLDINDSVWLPRFRWPELSFTLREVHGVICENQHVANYALQFNPRVMVVPDAPQVEVFDRFRDQVQRDCGQIVLGWIGGPENIGHLYRILEPLEALFEKYPQLRLRVVGADGGLPNFENIRWSARSFYTQEDMVREVLGFDIGLFPLFHNEDARGRGTLKAKVYMSGGAAVVCERYGENLTLIEDGVNGLLATSADEWYEQIERLILDPDLRSDIARRGLDTIRKSFTAEHVFAQLTAAFDAVLEDGRPSRCGNSQTIYA